MIKALLTIFFVFFVSLSHADSGYYNVLQSPSDVDRTRPNNGDVLTWNDTTKRWSPIPGGSGTVSSGNQNQVAYYATSGTALSGNNGFVFNGTNVGIGTATPGTILDINGELRTLGTNGHWFGNDNKASIAASSATNGALTFTTNNVETLRITNGNNVGIGTTLPSSLLEVGARKFNVLSNGNVGFGIANPITTLQAVGPSTLYSDPASSGLSTFGLFSGTGASTDNQLALGNNDASRYGYIQAIKAGTGFNALLLNANGGNVGVGTWKPSTLFEIGTQKFNFTTAGNLGIGLILPTSKFHILSSTLYTDPANSGTGGMILSDGTGINTDNALGIGTNAAGRYSYIQAVKPGTGFNALLLNASGGNVGIGSALPGAVLDVQGGIRTNQTTVGKATCTKANGAQGSCSSVVDVTGGCTCA